MSPTSCRCSTPRPPMLAIDPGSVKRLARCQAVAAGTTDAAGGRRNTFQPMASPTTNVANMTAANT